MATDATGSPTPLGIPKFNTSADAPSGLGSNAQMDALDTLITARVLKPVGLTVGDVPVWNGSAFVRPTGTASSSVFLRGDGSWQVISTGGAELDYAQIVADVTVSGTSGAQTTVITGNAVTYDGATSIVIEAALVGVLNGASDNVFLELWDGATSIGVTPAINTAGSGTQVEWPVVIKKRLTPTAAAHTYTLKAYRTTANGTVKAGPGTAGAVLPSFLRITKV